MAEYHFVTDWKLRGTAREVAEVLGDPLGLARWWPSVYLAVETARHVRLPRPQVLYVGLLAALVTAWIVPQEWLLQLSPVPRF